MAKIFMIDTSRPLELRAWTTDPVSTDIDWPTAAAEPLYIDARAFGAWLMASRWGKRLEEDLQCICQDAEGHPLLTSWLRANEFAELVRDAQREPFGPQLLRSYGAWIALGMSKVYFDGYRLSFASLPPCSDSDPCSCC